jgi:hypothetical protein
MNYRSNSIPYLMAISIMLIILYIVLTLLKIQVGTMIDWITGIVAFWWLTGITTLPWNMYFTAKDLLHEAKISEVKQIKITPSDIEYAQKQGKLFLTIAIVLHILSAVGLYLLAFYGISSIGYFAAVIAMVLTFVRPAYRLYDFVIERLQNIRKKILYPREDVHELRTTLDAQIKRIDHLVDFLDVSKKESWTFTTTEELKKIATHSKEVEQNLIQLSLENDKAHLDLSTKTQQEIAKLSEDAQFLNQARDLIRFFKNA